MTTGEPKSNERIRRRLMGLADLFKLLIPQLEKDARELDTTTDTQDIKGSTDGK